MSAQRQIQGGAFVKDPRPVKSLPTCAEFRTRAPAPGLGGRAVNVRNYENGKDHQMGTSSKRAAEPRFEVSAPVKHVILTGACGRMPQYFVDQMQLTRSRVLENLTLL